MANEEDSTTTIVEKAQESLLSSQLELSAVFRRLAGDPILKFEHPSGISSPQIAFKNRFNGSWKQVTFSSSAHLSLADRKQALSLAVMNQFYQQFLSKRLQKNDHFELGRLDRDTIIQTGVRRLQGLPAEDRIANAWWTVRMDQPNPVPESPETPKSVLFLTNNIGPADRLRLGHSSLGIREIGGDPDKDFTLDPRAPTLPSYKTSIRSIVFGDSSLINGVRVYNLWDWIAVQNQDRSVEVQVQVHRLSPAQTILLRDYTQWPEEYTSGVFHVLGNNCAALATQIIDAILPFEGELERSSLPVALPSVVNQKAAERFPVIANITFKAPTLASGNEGSVPNFVIKELPDRPSFYSFRSYLDFERNQF